ncbi:SymE family type I addiction module toxin [Paraburkholderia unamae]|uniref:SymE family type I addiction module toxin n=1 Tax=Paraburkholderia unamae TaxID=219649 RepID=UPI003CCC8099
MGSAVHHVLHACLNACTAHPGRRVTVQQSWRYRRINARTHTEPPHYPWIKLSGRWLELAGFEAGQQVRIEVHHGRLVITHE